MEKRALTVDEVADVVPIGRTTLFKEINAGRLRAHKAGRRTLILSTDLDDYLATLPTVGSFNSDELGDAPIAMGTA